jgi:hypothetical protein
VVKWRECYDVLHIVTFIDLLLKGPFEQKLEQCLCGPKSQKAKEQDKPASHKQTNSFKHLIYPYSFVKPRISRKA